MPEPEVYHFNPTPWVPNSRFPVLIYRQVLPLPLTEENAKQFLEKNNWSRGGTWGAIPRHHFHPNTHECYAVFQGSSTLLIGAGPLDDEINGRELKLHAGDVIILPAGVAHCSKDFQDGYRYLGLYPNGSPKWKNEFCRDSLKCQSLKEEAEGVEVPEWDPVVGYQGPLYRLWTSEIEAQ